MLAVTLINAVCLLLAGIGPVAAKNLDDCRVPAQRPGAIDSTPPLTDGEDMANPPPEMILAAMKIPALQKRAGKKGIDVGVYVHVLKSSEACEEVITDKLISTQMSVLNRHFAGYFNFTLKGTSRHVHELATCTVTQQRALRTAFHKGSRRDLNIYLVEKMTSANGRDAITGVASWPTWLGSSRYGLAYDGVIIDIRTLLDYPWAYKSYNRGITLVHEVGHWLGLFHTFQGGCRGDGDGVTDTNPQKEASLTCERRRSCSPGFLDPIDNLMDYGPDICRVKFTRGQMTRMQWFWQEFRAQDPKTATTATPQQEASPREQCAKFAEGSEEYRNCRMRFSVCQQLFPTDQRGAIPWDKIRQCMQGPSSNRLYTSKPEQPGSRQQPTSDELCRGFRRDRDGFVQCAERLTACFEETPPGQDFAMRWDAVVACMQTGARRR